MIYINDIMQNLGDLDQSETLISQGITVIYGI